MDAENETTQTVTTDAGLRQCPTVGGEPGSLITHVIAPATCLKRQREFYHKCHRCDYRGKPVDFRIPVTASGPVFLPPAPNGNGVSRRSSPGGS